MNVYVSERNEKESMLSEFNKVNSIEESDCVIITPGGMSSLSDLFEAIIEHKDLYLYNENQYYNQILEQLYKMYKSGYEKNAPFEYMKIESDFQNIVDDLNKKNNTETRHI